MESKLDSYRTKKRRQALLNQFKDRLYNMVSFQQVRVDEKSTHVIVEADAEDSPRQKPADKITPVHKSKSGGGPAAATAAAGGRKVRTLSDTESVISVASSSTSDNSDIPAAPKPAAVPRSYLTYVTYLVYFLFWATLYAIAIELRFGVVFLMLSALVGIYLNTRTDRERTPGEVSAYSVFNENCEAIDGTLKAEQFEREIGIRHH